MNTKPNLSIIVAVTRNGVIGRKGDMPFHIPSDLRRFKAITMGHPLVMGRRTFESLPKGALPGRRNIVVSRSAPAEMFDGAEVVRSLDEAFALCGSSDSGEIMICGGGEIYRQTIPMATRIYLTIIDAEVPDGDTFFPNIDHSQWQEETEPQTIVDERSGLKLTFVNYVRRQFGDVE